MRVIKAILRFLISRRLWTFIGLAILCSLIWLFGPLVSVGETAPLAGEMARGITIGAIAILWLFSMLLSQLLRLLIIFIGEALTLQLLHNIWSEIPKERNTDAEEIL